MVHRSWVFPSPRLLKQKLQPWIAQGDGCNQCDVYVLQSTCRPSTGWRSPAISQAITSADCIETEIWSFDARCDDACNTPLLERLRAIEAINLVNFAQRKECQKETKKHIISELWQKAACKGGKRIFLWQSSFDFDFAVLLAWPHETPHKSTIAVFDRSPVNNSDWRWVLRIFQLHTYLADKTLHIRKLWLLHVLRKVLMERKTYFSMAKDPDTFGRRH